VASAHDLKVAFATGLNVEVDEVDWASLEYRAIPEWDSVAHMAVIAEIEDAFDIMIDIDDVIAMSSFAIAQQIVVKYGVSLEDA
jgi:acyl carrier protein